MFPSIKAISYSQNDDFFGSKNFVILIQNLSFMKSLFISWLLNWNLEF